MRHKGIAIIALALCCIGLGACLVWLLYPGVCAQVLLANWQRDLQEQEEDGEAEELMVNAERTTDALLRLGPRAIPTVVRWAVANPAAPCFGYLLQISHKHEVPKRHWQFLVEGLLAEDRHANALIFLHHFASRADIPYIIDLFGRAESAEHKEGILYLLGHLNCLELGPSAEDSLELALNVARNTSEAADVRRAALGILAFGWYGHHEPNEYRIGLLREFGDDTDPLVARKAKHLIASLKALAAARAP